MRLAGFLLLPSGWIIVLAAVAILSPSPSRAGFAFAGAGVEVLGLSFVMRSHLIPRGDER